MVKTAIEREMLSPFLASCNFCLLFQGDKMDVQKIHHVNYEEHFKELWESFHSFKNMEIVGRSNMKISTSSVLLSICSQVLYKATKDILNTRELDLGDKMVVILPDISSVTIEVFINYMLGRTVSFNDVKEEEDMLQLLEIFRFQSLNWLEKTEESVASLDALVENNDILKSEPTDDNDEQISDVRKTFQTSCSDRNKVGKDVASYIDTLLESNDKILKSEPMGEGRDEDTDWKAPKPNVISLLTKDEAKSKVPKVKSVSKKKEHWFIKAKPLIDDELAKSMEPVNCSCGVNVTKLSHTLLHLKDLTKDWKASLDFRLRSDKKFRCPICYKYDFKKKNQATSHVRGHVHEIHDNVTVCNHCQKPLQYPNT